MANYNLKQRVDGFIWGKTFCGAFPRQPISQQSSCQRASAVKRPAAPNTHLKFCQKLLLQKISCSATPADDKLWMGRWRWAADPDSGGAKLPWARQQGIACNTRELEQDSPMSLPCNKRHQQRNWLNLFSPHPPTWWLHHVNFDSCKLKCALKTALPRRYCTKKVTSKGDSGGGYCVHGEQHQQRLRLPAEGVWWGFVLLSPPHATAPPLLLTALKIPLLFFLKWFHDRPQMAITS